MRLVEILQSRAIRFGFSFNPPLFLPDMIGYLVETLRFVEFPNTVEGFTAEGGITLRYGKFDNFIIDTLKIFGDALFMESSVSTIQLDKALDFIIAQLQDEFGLSLSNDTIVKRFYNSRIVVQTNSSLNMFADQLAELADAVTNISRSYGIETGAYAPIGITIGVEGKTSQSKIQPGKFMIERRVNTAAADNIFFAEAGAATDDHLRLLQILYNH